MLSFEQHDISRVFLQQNVQGTAEALTALMKTAVKEKADLVLVQEPPTFEGNRHPGFEFLRAGRVLSARRVDSDWTITTEDSYTREAEGDVQVLVMGRRGHRGRVVRVVNAYFQKRGRGGTYRPAERAQWDDILGDGDCVLAGISTHTARCGTRGAQREGTRLSWRT